MGGRPVAWEKHGARRYFYRSVRRGGRVTKVYFGAGPAGEFAAAADALRRTENAAAAESARGARTVLNNAIALTEELCLGCGLLAACALLAAGYHRPSRHAWRVWRNGRRTLQQT